MSSVSHNDFTYRALDHTEKAANEVAGFKTDNISTNGGIAIGDQSDQVSHPSLDTPTKPSYVAVDKLLNWPEMDRDEAIWFSLIAASSKGANDGYYYGGS